MKYLPIFSILFISMHGYSQSKAIAVFSTETQAFDGTKVSQAEFLLREVKPMGIIASKNADLPPYIYGLMNHSVHIISADVVTDYIKAQKMDLADVGGSLFDSLSKNIKGTQAKYFVIHDTSTPNFMENDFPENINEDTWSQNDVSVRWKYKINKNTKEKELRKGPHAFIGRTGKVFFPIDFSTPYRATKFENEVLSRNISRGLFVHIELIQPRKTKPGKWMDNDILAPDPGFSKSQYEKLALLYICASTRAGEWLVPAFHAVLDQGIKNGHDDPQNFELSKLSDCIEKLVGELQ